MLFPNREFGSVPLRCQMQCREDRAFAPIDCDLSAQRELENVKQNTLVNKLVKLENPDLTPMIDAIDRFSSWPVQAPRTRSSHSRWRKCSAASGWRCSSGGGSAVLGRARGGRKSLAMTFRRGEEGGRGGGRVPARLRPRPPAPQTGWTNGIIPAARRRRRARRCLREKTGQGEEE